VKWRIIDKKSVVAPAKGSYSDWKPQLAKEAAEQCVYCCIHESKFGGMRNFHVEHLRPQSIFPDLTNTYENLFYACGVCNIYKSNDWPGDHSPGDFSKPAYPDPSAIDYGTFLSVDSSTGFAISDTLTGKYLIERLHLNRPHVVGLRMLASVMSRVHEIYDEMEMLHGAGEIPLGEKDAVLSALFELRALMKNLGEVKPYGAEQLKAAS